MSVAEERVARSVALEKAYVHDVYEQFSDGPRGRPWPKVNQFLADLEPGSLVCDVGCGNGKYLSVNPAVFNLGADKCSRLTKVAREKENEVLVCDNLALPFRDESFDAVLSVAVVHHFATTERRVCALRELARILRIGGRLIISVWAMEQTHRKFESQDVLVPWHRPQTLSTPSLELTSTTNTSEEDVLPPYHAYTQTSDSDSNKSLRARVGFRKRGRTRHKGRSIDPGRSSSPSSSSLSSPNETCYSFVRRAIQKLAGGRRSGTSNRPWFLETWNSCTKEPPQKRYDPDGCESYDCANVQDLPIELRRVDDDEPPQRRQTFPSSQITTVNDLYGGIKSKSLTNIKTFEDRSMVRSQSSVPSLQDVKTDNESEQVKPPEINIIISGISNNDVNNGDCDGGGEGRLDDNDCDNKNGNNNEVAAVPTTTRTRGKPKLVKQKQSICDEDAEEALDKPTDMQSLISPTPELKNMHGHRRGVFKQRSMNEELMSTERLREKERVKRNIQKQASLNEELIYQRHALDSLRDSIFSVSTSKRFQLIKSGFTNTLKNSTTNIEKVAGSSLKNGFVRMFQGWKSTELVVSPTQSAESAEELIENSNTNKNETTNNKASDRCNNCSGDEKRDGSGCGNGNGTLPGERRHSREDGSDSSKDSSLQSDTSVDSEDSFASVIFVPKPDPLSPTPLSPGPTSPRLVKQTSVPNSPRMKQSSCPTSPRIKQMPLTVYPLTKQLSSPKPSTNNNNNNTSTTAKTISPNSLSASTPKPKVDNTKSSSARDQLDDEANKKNNNNSNDTNNKKDAGTNNNTKRENLAQKYSVVMIPKFNNNNNNNNKKPIVTDEPLRKPIAETSEVDVRNEDVKRNDRLRQIRELLNQRPGFGIRSSRSAFPIVRHSSTGTGRSEPLARPLPRLLSLELFNPETDDKDSDSSGVSSPDSVDSVINIELPDNNQGAKSEGSDGNNCERKISPTKFAFPPISESNLESETAGSDQEALLEEPRDEKTTKLSPTSMSLLEAAADVANSLDEAVDAVIQSSPRAKRRQLTVEAKEVISVMERQYNMTDDYEAANNTVPNSDSTSSLHEIEETWDEECHKHLTDFADKLSEKLLQEIDQYQEQSRRNEQKEVKFSMSSSFQHIDDPYIHRLSEELNDLNKLSAEIQKQNEILSKLSKSDLLKNNNNNNNNNSNNSKPSAANDSNNSKQCIVDRIHSGCGDKCDKVPYLLTKCYKDIAENKSDSNNVVDQGSFKDSLTGNRLCSVDATPTSELDAATGGVRNLLAPRLSRESSDASDKAQSESKASSSATNSLHFGHSLDSNDAVDVSERTTASCSDSQKDTNSVSRYSDYGSTASLGSCPEWRDVKSLSGKSRFVDGRSSSEETREMKTAEEQILAENTASLNASLSDTSQDSLPSDNIGGAITYHRYYHVFREGELDQLIERYVENLHIISSYYDHASWCVVAEKVQVWTI